MAVKTVRFQTGIYMMSHRSESQLPTWVSFIFLWSSICSDEVEESTIPLNELRVGPHLTDLPTVQYHNEVTLREKAKTMGDKDAGLGEGEERVKIIFCQLKYSGKTLILTI